MKDEDKIMSLKEIAAYFGIHMTTARRHVKLKQLPVFKIGNKKTGLWRCRKKDIEGWITKRVIMKRETK